MSSTATRRGLLGLLVAVLAFGLAWLIDARLPRFGVDLFRHATLPPPAPPGERPPTALAIENSEILIVDIMRDDNPGKSVDEATLARIIRRATELGAVSVGVDAVFEPRAETPGLEDLRRAIKDSGKVILAASYEPPPPGSNEPSHETRPCCGLATHARAQGVVHVHRDVGDWLYSMNHLYREPGIVTPCSLPLELAAWHVTAGTTRAPVETGRDALLIKAAGGPVYAIPFEPGGRSLVPYIGPAGSIPAISWKKLFEPKPPPLGAKTVILGSGRTDIPDSYPTPFHRERRGRISGTELLAQTFLGMICAHRHPYPSLASPFTQNLLRGLLIGVGVLAGALLSPPVALAVLALLFCLVWVNTYQLYAMTQTIVSPLGPSLGLAFAGISAVLARSLALHAERLQLEGLMETYFEEELVPGQAGASHTESQLVARLLAAKGLLAPPGMIIEGHLGSGGMSVVLAARQKAGGREVALKLLSPQLFRDEESRHRFRREAQTACSIVHDNVVGVIASGNRLGFLFMPYIAYQRVRGPTLRAMLLHEGKFTPGRAAAISIQVLRGLAAAHEKNIVHRDVKPENVIITPEGVVKVLDFGIARVAEADDGFRTRTGIVLGTPAYMAPEVVRGQLAGPAADIYAVGTMMYELITGQTPFAMDNISAMLVAHLEKQATSPSERGVEIPRALEAGLMSMLEKRPEERPATALAAIEMLAPFASSIVGPQLPIQEGPAGASTSATRAVKPSLAASGTVAVPTNAGNRLSSARVITPPAVNRPTLDEETPAIHSAPTARYSEPPAQPEKKGEGGTPPRIEPRTRS